MTQTVDDSWDVDQYRTRFEPKEHWDLKKEFMDKHKTLIEEDRLICLAQVYVNVELLGCRYPAPVMKQVNALGDGLGMEYRSSRQGKLKRTFVGAQQAATAKVQRSKGPLPFKKGF